MADFYIRSAASLEKVLTNSSSVKAAAAPHHDSKRVLALLVNTLAYRQPLTHVIQQVNVSYLERKTFPPSSASASSSSSSGPDKFKNTKSGAVPKSIPKPSLRGGPKGSSSQGGQIGPKGSSDRPSSESLLLVLCHDLLFSHRGIQAAKAWPPKVALEKHKARLHSELVKLQLKQGKNRIQDLRAGSSVGDSNDGRSFDQIVQTIPRWVRVNLLKTTVQEVHLWLQSHGWTLVPPPPPQQQNDGQLKPIELTSPKSYAVSLHIPSLLAFTPKSTSAILASELYSDGRIVLQDLASCMPAQILNPLYWEEQKKQNGDSTTSDQIEAIDATSAPGNKTSHLSALMKGSGKITAFERSPQRYKTLTKLLTRAGALRSDSRSSASKVSFKTTGNVETVQLDFLQTDPSDPQWQNVKYMLVDPSCSGSGIVNRLDYLKQDDDDDDDEENDTVSIGEEEAGLSEEETTNPSELGQKRKRDDPSIQTAISKKQRRLDKLAEFQLLMLRHAMKFPALERLVYSTCSIHSTENENVVEKVLLTNESLQNGWILAPRCQVLPTWNLRGQSQMELAESMIRCFPGGQNGLLTLPNTESCNGFFVACLVRSLPQQQQQEKRQRKTQQNRKKALRKKQKKQQQQQQQHDAEDDGLGKTLSKVTKAKVQ